MSSRSIGVDTGGTFTDLVEEVDGRLVVRKVPSTPDDPSAAIVIGLEHYRGAPFDLIHGSTVATNALLERRGARTLLLVTAGFEDLLRIGRQARRDIYDLDVEAVEPLVAADDTLGVEERLAADGSVVVALGDAEVARIRDAVDARGPESVAICLLHSYTDPSHERALAAALGHDGFVTASSEVLPEFREYERCSTTVVNAYVGPVMSRYLRTLEERSGARRVRVMQSNGGAMAARNAGDNAVHTVLSGPAGGVVGAFAAAREAGRERIVTFDMGGTSTDVSLCDGRPAVTAEAEIAGMPVRVPVLDIHTVGAGGGSIATIDRGGALRVGPRSAGASPGPACYGNGGTEATVTDANLVLGRLSADRFLGGERRLDPDAAQAVVGELARRMGVGLEAAAEGVARVADATMEAAIRVISVERGHDPRDFTLVCFGGAGGMHAASLATALRMPRVLVPPAPGVLSALGMLRAEPGRHLSRTVLGSHLDRDRERLEEIFAEIESTLAADPLLGGSAEGPRFERTADLRYRGQGFELGLAWGPDLAFRFHSAHEARYGYADRDREVELVTVRVRASLAAPDRRREPTRLGPTDPAAAHGGACAMVFAGKRVEGALYDRDGLRPGHRVEGPALVVEYSATTVVPPEWAATVDGFDNLILERAGS